MNDKVKEALRFVRQQALQAGTGSNYPDAYETLRAHIEGLEARLATQTDNALVLEARVRELEAYKADHESEIEAPGTSQSADPSRPRRRKAQE